MSQLDWIIPVGCLAVVAAAAAMRRRHEATASRLLAGQRGWEVSSRRERVWRDMLRDVSLLRIGHSRRLGTAFRTRRGFHVLSYTCETGFEHRRETHQWRVAAREIEHGCGRAAVTAEAWLLATTASPVAHRIPLDGGGERSPSNGTLTAVAENFEEWSGRLSGDLGAWFLSQPADRSWEILPGLIVGYEPGPFDDKAMEALATDAAQLLSHLARPSSAKAG